MSHPYLEDEDSTFLRNSGHGVTSQKTGLFIVTVKKISNRAK
jgi:hypothetical protein